MSTAGRVITLLGLMVGAGLLMVLGSMQAASAEETAPEAGVGATDTGSTETVSTNTRKAPRSSTTSTRSADTGTTATSSTDSGTTNTGATETVSRSTRRTPRSSTGIGSTDTSGTGSLATGAVETTEAGDACATASTSAVVAGRDPCNNPNDPECYEFLGFGTCEKFDGVNAQTFEVPELPEGFHYTLAIVKAGSEQSGAGQEFHTCTGVNCNAVQPGQILTHSTGKDISYVILCTAADGSPPPPPLPPPPPPPLPPVILGGSTARLFEVEVAGAGPVARGDAELPRTGAPARDLAIIGFILLLSGAGLGSAAAARRRRIA